MGSGREGHEGILQVHGDTSNVGSWSISTCIAIQGVSGRHSGRHCREDTAGGALQGEQCGRAPRESSAGPEWQQGCPPIDGCHPLGGNHPMQSTPGQESF